MDNRSRSIRSALALVMTVLMLFLCGGAMADADPIRVSSLSEPQSVISEQEVSITIKVYNSSQTDMEEEITLFNPEGISVQKYSGLKGEQSVTYTGKWNVTRDQIDEGKIKYYIRYTVDTANGPTETTRTVPVTIQTEEAAPRLTATYSVSPVSAREGQTVTLSYTLSNTGNVELRNIVIENDGVSKEELTAASLSVGEKVTLTDSFTMGSKELVSKPSITYQAANAKKSLTISDMARKTITVAEDGLEIELTAENSKNVYPGEKLPLQLALKNTGDHAYSGLNVMLSDGTAAVSGVELAPGASYEQEVLWSAQDAVLTASVSGTDESGETVGVVSSELEITTQDATNALILNVMADSAADVIHSEPAVLRFGVVVENIGEYDATNLTILQAGTTVAKIPSLPAGESRTVVFDLETSIAGKFQFEVSGRDGAGVEKSYASNILEIGYLAPTPTPTAVPTPTPVPPTPTPVPTATPAPTLGEIISEHVNLNVLYGVAAALAAAIIAILTVSGVSSAKRKKRMEQAIDTIERTPDVRNHRGVVRRRRNAPERKEDAKQDKKAGKGRKEALKDEAIVPVSELTEEEASRMTEASARKQSAQAVSATPAKDAMRQVNEENRRRRAVQEIPTDETLRVAPVDQRPEFVAQGKVDDSQTRIFGKIQMEKEIQEEQAAQKKTAEPAKEAPKADVRKAEPRRNIEEELTRLEKKEKTPEVKAEEPKAEEATIRISRGQIEEIRTAEQREDNFRKSHKGQTRGEIKPMKKKKNFLFGRKEKNKDEDDMFEEIEYADDAEDDLFE
ncbi:MAG: hypothetical protein IJN79_02380 [Clostridia bacterium]|nr:hypothetical protein [Clostridia bacterium]MBQ7051630.1 hypothetical protein [Clostridia bacterium]